MSEICHFFLQGRCRYGKDCKFKHSYENDDRNNRNPSNTQQLSNVVKQIVEEVILAEKGGQWPLSCFSPVKGGPNIPGWEDVSPEEVRWKMYEARAKGTLNQCTAEVNQLYNNAEKMRNLLKEPTMERVNLIVNVLKGKREPTNSPGEFTNTSANIFGGSTQSSGNIFRNVTPTTGTHGSLFGSSSAPSGSIFGGSAQTSENIFGGSKTFSNQNIFGGSSTTNAFSQNAFSNSQTPSQNIFSNPSSQRMGNIFSNATVSSQNIFSKPVEGTNQNSFLQQNSAGIFSNQTQNAPLFGSNSTFFQKTENQTQSNIFGASQNENVFKSQNIFSNSNNNAFNTEQEPAKSVFGGSSQQNAFNNSHQLSKEFDSSVYSKVEDLSEDEIKAFTSPTFTFGKIPLKPPLKEYCM